MPIGNDRVSLPSSSQNADIYLKAAELLGISRIDCIAVEDSGNGAAAAIKAGMTCVVVPNEYTKTHDFTGAYVLQSFADLEEVMVQWAASLAKPQG